MFMPQYGLAVRLPVTLHTVTHNEKPNLSSMTLIMQYLHLNLSALRGHAFERPPDRVDSSHLF